MKAQTEKLMRNLAKMDGEIKGEDLERAITVMRGVKEDGSDLVHVIRRKDAMRMLHVHRRTLDYYIAKGYLERVFAGGQRALGISRESFIRFTSQRARRIVGKPMTQGVQS